MIYYGGARICPEGTEVINPAFDIVPKDLITGIITEKGVIDLNNLEKDFKDLFRNHNSKYEWWGRKDNCKNGCE